MTSKIQRSAAQYFGAAVICALSAAPALLAQGTLADYQRAQGLQAKARNLVVNTPGAISWIGDSDRFWYPRSAKGGTEFILGDAGAGSKQLAFDHDKLAAAISTAHRRQAGEVEAGARPQAQLQQLRR